MLPTLPACCNKSLLHLKVCYFVVVVRCGGGGCFQNWEISLGENALVLVWHK